MSKKRRREVPGVDAQDVEIYEDLANDNEEVRLKAAQRLLSKLAPEKAPGPDIIGKYLKRLIRGLCSGRKAARIGFSVALTEILAQHATPKANGDCGELKISEVIDLLLQVTQVSGGISGQEERDHYFGKLFGAEAIIKSKVLFASYPETKTWERLLDIIFELAKKKTWLREECGWVLLRSLQILKSPSHGQSYARFIVEKLNSQFLAKTSEGVALWVLTQECFPNLTMPENVFRNDDPLHKKERVALAQILRETSALEGLNVEEQKHAQKGNWFPNVHFAWDIVLDSLLDSESHGKRTSFSNFWKEAVDEGLFSASASNQRKYWGFQIFQRYVLKVPHKDLPALFGPNFVRCLSNQLSTKDRVLRINAERSIKSILSRSKQDSAAATELATQIMAVGSNLNGAAKTRTLNTMFVEATTDSLKNLVSFAERLSVSEKGTDDERRKSCQILASALANAITSRPFPSPQEPDSEQYGEVVNAILRILIGLAYGDCDASWNAFQAECKSRIAQCLTSIIVKDQENPAHHAYSALCAIRDIRSAAMKADADVSVIIADGWKALEKLHDMQISASGKKKTLGALELLLVFTFLRLYDDEADAVNMIEELQKCYESLVNPESTGIDGKESALLVEIILSFVSRPSVLYRRLASQVFSAYTGGMDKEALHSLFQILRTRESVSGQDELFDQEADGSMAGEGEDEEHEAEDEDEDEDEDEADQDVQMVDEDASDVEVEIQNGDLKPMDSVNSDDDDDNDDDNDDSNDGSGDDVDDAELAAFDAKLAQALGTRRADEDAKIAEEESSDEDMDDAQMEALDPLLATMFKQRRDISNQQKKKEKKESRDNIVLFKCRVIELLEIYVKQEYYSKPLALSVIVPLLETMRSTTDKEVSKKASNVVREFMKLYKLHKASATNLTADTDEESRLPVAAAARTLLATVHAMAKLEGSNVYADTCSRASILAAKVLLSHGGELEEVLQQYLLTEKDWLTQPECRVRPSFFGDWRNWATQARQTILKMGLN